MHTRFADWRWAGFLAKKFIQSTEISATTKLSSGDENPPIANVLLGLVLLFNYFEHLFLVFSNTQGINTTS